MAGERPASLVPPVVDVTGPAAPLDEAFVRRLEQEVLPAFLVRQRWFGAKARAVTAARVVARAPLPVVARPTVLCLVQIEYREGPPDVYQVPIAMASQGPEAGGAPVCAPGDVIARLDDHGMPAGIAYDAGGDVATAAALLAAIRDERTTAASGGAVRGVLVDPDGLRGTAGLSIRRSGADQSNTAFLYGDRLILKLFRRLEAGPNPDFEIGRQLTNHGFAGIPRLVGALEYAPTGEEATTLGILQELVANSGTAWDACLDDLRRYLAAPGDESVLRPSIASARQLGVRTGELHVALAAVRDPAFTPVPLDEADVTALLDVVRDQAMAAFGLLEDRLASVDATTRPLADAALARRGHLLQALATPLHGPFGERIRVHGDYHLGQVLRTPAGDDFVILDFEGEPARPLGERRAVQSPLKDVAGMRRSFGYAGQSALIEAAAGRDDRFAALGPAAEHWTDRTCLAFLAGYHAATAGASFLPPTARTFEWLLDVLTLDKACYELRYELNSRPDWVRIPLAGLLAVGRTGQGAL